MSRHFYACGSSYRYYPNGAPAKPGALDKLKAAAGIQPKAATAKPPEPARHWIADPWGALYRRNSAYAWLIAYASAFLLLGGIAWIIAK